jgi:hypothetical protein
MAKKTDSAVVAATPVVEEATSTELAFPATDALTVDGRLDAAKTLQAYGYAEDAFEFAPDAPPHYWVPEANTVIFGIVEGEFTYEKTKLTDKAGDPLPMKSYVLRLTRPAVGVSTETKEAEMLEVGDLLSVADRAAVKKLAECVGKEVCVLCYAKIELANKKSFWKMKVGLAKEVISK